MRNDPRFTRAALLIPFAEAFAQRGGNIRQMLNHNGLSTDVLRDPGKLIDAASCYCTLEDMAAALGDPYFCASVAIDVARKGTPLLKKSTVGAVTLGDFLSRAISESARQFDNVGYSMNVLPEIVTFEIKRRLRLPFPTSQVDASTIAFYITLLKLGLRARFDASRIIVNTADKSALPRGVLKNGTFFRSDVSGTRLSFPTEWLWSPFSIAWINTEPRDLDQGDSIGAGFARTHLRQVLLNNIEDGDFDLRRFSAACGMHERSLQRYLSSQGTTFQGLRDDVRRDRALERLTVSDLSIADIASEVGFSSAAAFNRAFRRWMQETPSSSRDRTRGENGSLVSST